MRVIGFDPGNHGALGLIDSEVRTLFTAPLPIIVEKRSKGNKTFLDEDKLADLIQRLHPDEAWIEDVFSSSQMGVVSSFTFGEGKGILKGILGASRVPRRYVSPATWKAFFRTSADKDHTKTLVRSMFPSCKRELSSEGKCEATLIALYGLLQRCPLSGPLKPAV